MKKLIGSMVGMVTAVALAGSAEAAPEKVFETATIGAYGGPLGVALFSTKFEPMRMPTGLIAQRFSLPAYSPTSLQLEMVPQAGLGVSLVTSFVKTDGFRLNLNVGYFRKLWGQQMSVPDMPRKFDVTGGLATEFHLDGTDTWLTAEYRVFLPDPGLTKTMNSVYVNVAQDAVKGGQLWLGVKHCW